MIDLYVCGVPALASPVAPLGTWPAVVLERKGAKAVPSALVPEAVRVIEPVVAEGVINAVVTAFRRWNGPVW